MAQQLQAVRSLVALVRCPGVSQLETEPPPPPCRCTASAAPAPRIGRARAARRAPRTNALTAGSIAAAPPTGRTVARARAGLAVPAVLRVLPAVVTPAVLTASGIDTTAVRLAKECRTGVVCTVSSPTLPDAAVRKATKPTVRPIALTIPGKTALGAATPAPVPGPPRGAQRVLTAGPVPIKRLVGTGMTRSPEGHLGLLAVPRRIQLRSPASSSIASAALALH